MEHIPERLSPRDALLFSLAKVNGHVMYLQAEAARQGLTGLEEDLSQLWREVMRIESDTARMAYRRTRGRTGAQLRALPGLQ